MGERIDCRTLARQMNESSAEIAAQVAGNWRRPCLALLVAGNDPASAVYVRNKNEACAKAGIDVKMVPMPAYADTEYIIDIIEALNRDNDVDGIMLQLPVPPSINARIAIDRISPRKDVDGLTTYNQGGMMTGMPWFIPCTAQAVSLILDFANIGIGGKDVCIIGRSNVVGKPLAALMTDMGATVTVCHRGTHDLPEKTMGADIIVAAAGCAGLVKPEMVKPGAVLIDVGISVIDGRMTGDIDPRAHKKASCYTTVPGGVGPVTVSSLVRNVTLAAVSNRLPKDRR